MVTRSKKSETLAFSVDARAVLQLGRQSIRDHTTALLELVKNSYDADSSEVLVDIDNARGTIRIVDNGVGMSPAEFKARWLRIGFSQKRRARRSPKGGRTVVGEKGVGRISADRLGARLTIRSAASNTTFEASVDWDSFDVEDRLLESIEVAFQEGVEPNFEGLQVPPKTGTELRISRLRQKWSTQDVERLRGELSRLISPWASAGEFRIFLVSDARDSENGLVEAPWTRDAQLELNATVRSGIVNVRVIDRSGKKERKSDAKIAWSDVPGARPFGRAVVPLLTGPFEISLLYLPRKQLQLSRGGLPLRSVQERVLGVRVFRDGVRIRPYGDIGHPEGDWLGLADRKAREPAGVARPTYKVSPTELAGAIRITRRRNPQLTDSAGREGLIEDEAFRQLRLIVSACLGELEKARHAAEMSRRASEPVLHVEAAVEGFEASVRAATTGLAELRTQVRALAVDPDPEMFRAINQSLDSLRMGSQAIDLLQNEHRLYRGLASIGIATSVFGHETEAALSKCAGGITEAGEALGESPPDLKGARRFVALAEANIQRVAAWGRFAVTRVRSDRRRRVTIDAAGLASELANEFEPVFGGTGVSLDSRDIERASLKAVPMDIEAILINFLTNAYAFSSLAGRAPKVRIVVRELTDDSAPGVELAVGDSGPGVPEKDAARIWEPLVSTRRNASGKEVGTGLGLAIVDSIVREYHGRRSVGRDSRLKGAIFSVWLPK